jgi:hypothetical protein
MIEIPKMSYNRENMAYTLVFLDVRLLCKVFEVILLEYLLYLYLVEIFGN